MVSVRAPAGDKSGIPGTALLALFALLSAAALVVPSASHAAGGRHSLAVTARVVGHCKLDSQAARADSSIRESTDVRVSCSRNAAKPWIVSTPDFDPAGTRRLRMTEAPARAAPLAAATVVTILY